MRYGNVEIKKQIQIFVTVSYYFRMQVIRYMETDKDHIHYMIETEPTMSISKIVNLMKSYTTYHIWKRYPDYPRKYFWKEHTFWADGYFVCSVGNFEKFGFDEVFGRSAVMEFLELKGSGASKLLSNLVQADIIEPVSGHGKGRYKFKK